MTRVALLDYGVGNVGSVRRAFERLGAQVVTTSDPALVAESSRVVLPGVGAFAPARARLASSGLDGALRAAVGRGARLLGLCLGFQLLFEASEEFGTTEGLGLLPGRVVPFPPGVRVPHVGWNRLETEGAAEGPLLAGLPRGTYVYFVHSFRPEGAEPGDVAAYCDHGGRFVAAARRGNVWGCQFHPERSSGAGRRILANFLSEAA
ncbi:MAG TPA: imidazole glycerol phosphate synthase subunit HisH [Thermoanaerobaculia bacterium]|jgi:glutamine amidotransferase|nr:imidazole glycerol phosphate synthase subunit HisH [Thermoanaerobaculia bacterium]HPA52265.1 imidazole glycerol phosphate synthase subunit HisH [Thermoanaerobaculia bacterium]HQN08643.1 imidazole glycerol phosphate synthase subunit HisH [Thermoanaerobaculia bacterium]HQP87502.1 imidazole glycerol phosphate synthase subunit HisH [Thermoanaerobaculia bacterium]